MDRKVGMSDFSFYDFIYTFKSSNPDIYYTVLVNKVRIDYCSLRKNSSFDQKFKKRIRLKRRPYVVKLEAKEVEMFKVIFRKLSNLQGKVHYTSS